MVDIPNTSNTVRIIMYTMSASLWSKMDLIVRKILLNPGFDLSRVFNFFKIARPRLN